MKIFIDITDKRNQVLKQILEDQGYETYELLQLNLHTDLSKKCIIFAPSKKLTLLDIESLPNDSMLFAGNLTDEVTNKLQTKNIEFTNIMQSEEFAIKNALLTSEGVLAYILEHSNRSIFENKVLILGAGRIAKATAQLFLKLGIEFGIATYNHTEYTNALYFTKKRYYENSFLKDLNEYSVIINTRPFTYFTDDMINQIPPNTLFIETASIPCLDSNKVDNFQYILAPALPQKYTCETAGKILAERIIGEINK